MGKHINRKALIQAREDAQTNSEILEAEARISWANKHQGAECPANQKPALENLYEWLTWYPADVLERVDQFRDSLCPEPTQSTWERFDEFCFSESGNISMLPDSLWNEHLISIACLFTQSIKTRTEMSLKLFIFSAKCLDAPWIKTKDRGNHPLFPLIESWQERPIEGNASLDRTDRIMPATLAMVEPNDRRSGRLFTPALHTIQQDNSKQLALFPGFGLKRPRITPALPLVLYDLGGGSSMARGKGAPLSLRLWVESILAVNLSDRNRNQPIVLEVTLRDLLAKLYPGNRQPRPKEYWPRLNRAVEILDTTRIPWMDPETGKGGLRRILNVSGIPRGPRALDDPVRIIVDLPPGSGVGPVVSPNLAWYGVESAPLYRGLLNLAYHWFEPGRTRWPVRKGKHWIQTKDPRRYAKVTDDLLIELFYPTTAAVNRRKTLFDSWKCMEKLISTGEAQIVKGRLLPPTIDDVRHQSDAFPRAPATTRSRG